MRAAAGGLRATHVVVDPELPKGDPVGGYLEASGWQRVQRVQPLNTRVIDLTREEDALFSDLRSSARWSVNKARRSGITVERGGGELLDEFGALYRETVERIGDRMQHRANFEAVFRAFDARGLASIVMARDAQRTPLATLMLISTGPRMNELYGAASAAGFKARANYLVKWEAMRWSRERGFVSYDLWGTDEPNLAEFKAGFGGEERSYDGAFELITNRSGRSRAVDRAARAVPGAERLDTGRALMSIASLLQDDAAWDEFVATSTTPTHMQLTAWARVKAANGWRPLRVVADGGSGPIGAQVLIRRLGPGPFAMGYAARGPIATSFDGASLAAFDEALRRAAQAPAPDARDRRPGRRGGTRCGSPGGCGVASNGRRPARRNAPDRPAPPGARAPRRPSLHHAPIREQGEAGRHQR